MFFSREKECNVFNFRPSYSRKHLKTENIFINSKIKVMKKVSLFSMIVACFLLVTNLANATGSRTEFKDFSITPMDDLVMGKKVEAVWTISYSSDEKPVTVVKRNTIDGTEYVVHSQFFEVSYVATSEGFGTKQVRNSWRNVPKKINKAVISQDEFMRQQVITPNQVDDKKALGLIASYLPDLINDGYTHLLN